jgi:hypothetical protein
MAMAATARQRLGGLGAATLPILAGLAAGCVVSPVPQPPPLGLDVEGTTMDVDACPACDVRLVEVRGPAGSVTGDGVELWVVNLDSTARPQTHPVEDDGSFAVMLEAAPGQELRFQARREEQRSDPVDIVGAEDGSVTLVSHALEPCFSLEPRLELDFGVLAGPRSIDLASDCEAEVEIEVRLRAPSTAFVIGESPSSLSSGEAGALTVTRPSGMPDGLTEEILFVEVVAPERDRRAVTLIATGPGD